MADETLAEDLTTEDERPAGEAGTTLTDDPAQHASEDRDAADTGEQHPSQNVPYQRFKKVNDRANAYAKLGSPEEIAERLKLIDEFKDARDRAAEVPKQEEAARTFDASKEQRRSQLATLLDEFEPGTAQFLRQQGETQRLTVQRHHAEGFKALKEMAEANGLETDPETLEAYDAILTKRINSDDTLHAQYWNPTQQREAVEAAFAPILNMHNKVLMKAGAQKLDVLARRRASSVSRDRPAGVPSTVEMDATPKSTDPLKREAEWKVITNRAIDAHWDQINPPGSR